MRKICLSATLLFFAALPLIGVEVVVKTPEGEMISLDVGEEERVGDLISQVENYHEEGGVLDFWAGECEEAPAAKGAARPYRGQATQYEKSTLRYIILSLSNQKMLWLLAHEGELDRKGNSIDHMHPLDYWQTIFTDKEMIAAMHNIPNRSRVWKKFISRSGDTLSEEHARGNLRPEQIRSFCRNVKVRYTQIEPLLRTKQWEKFVRTLIAQVPRGSDNNRYNM